MKKDVVEREIETGGRQEVLIDVVKVWKTRRHVDVE